MLSLIWDDEQYSKLKIQVSPPGWMRALAIFVWMMVCHVVFWLPESSSRASHKLKHKFSGDTKKLIEAAEGSKMILSRVLPKELIPRVRKLQEGQAIADEFDNVTIIFAKIIGLHEMFETLPTVQVVGVIDRLYRQIDALITNKHTKIEKIKTVGDTYMAGAGLPTPTKTHAVDMAHFAFALAQEIMIFNEHYRLGTMGRAEKLDYKIGISSGPIVAGVIGRANPVYDLWGDAANTASRMYSFGKQHHIQTTKQTIDMIDSDFEWVSRGKIKVKGKGLMECFFILGPKEGVQEKWNLECEKKRRLKYIQKGGKGGRWGKISRSVRKLRYHGRERKKNSRKQYNAGVSGLMMNDMDEKGHDDDEEEVEEEEENKGTLEAEEEGIATAGVKHGVIKRNRTVSGMSLPEGETVKGANNMMMLAHMNSEQFLKLMLETNEVFDTNDERAQANNALLGLRVDKEKWVADSEQLCCIQCEAEFTFFFRRHHCRFCGRLLCDNCTTHRIINQRACNSCNSTYLACQNKNDWLSKAQEKEDAEEYKKASTHFVSPCLAFCGSQTKSNGQNNKLKILNRAYQKDRVTDMKRRQLQLWFAFLLIGIGFFHVMNSLFLPHRCQKFVFKDDYSSLKSYSFSDSDCTSKRHPGIDIEKEIRFSYGSNITLLEIENGYLVNVTYKRRIEDPDLQAASLLTGLGFYPLVIIYVYITQRPFTLKLFWLGATLLNLCLLVLLILSLRFSILYGYLLSICILMIQVTSPMEMAVSIISTSTTWALYIIIFTILVQGSPEKYSLTDFLNHALEKQTPIVVIAWFAGYVMDNRHREIYLKTESVRLNPII